MNNEKPEHSNWTPGHTKWKWNVGGAGQDGGQIRNDGGKEGGRHNIQDVATTTEYNTSPYHQGTEHHNRKVNA